MRNNSNLQKRGNVYYVRAVVNKKPIYESLRTGDKELAIAKKNKKLSMVRRGEWHEVDAARQARNCPSLGEVITRYRQVSLERALAIGKPKATSVEGYITQLRNVVTTALGGDQNIDNLPVSILDRTLLERYVSTTLSSYDATNELMMERGRRTAYSTITNARAVFAGWAIDKMYDMALPDLRDFLKAKVVAAAKIKYRLPPSELIEKTIVAGKQLEATNPDLFLGFLLCYPLALRSREACCAEKSWFLKREENGQTKYYCDITKRENFYVKNNKSRLIPMTKATYDAIFRHLREGDPFILPGGFATYRHNLIGRELAFWMRGLGWSPDRYSKAAHELRKLMGSEWYTRYGVEVCAAWLGDTIQVVWDYYADLKRHPEPIDF